MTQKTRPGEAMLEGILMQPGPGTLYRRIYESLAGRIISGQLTANTRLPSTRYLAQVLSVSRNTVSEAFEQLVAEGYLESRPGSGTYVSTRLPDEAERRHATVQA